MELRGGDPIKIKSEIRALIEKLGNGTLQKLTVSEFQQDRDNAIVAARVGHPMVAGDPRSALDETLELLVAAILAVPFHSLVIILWYAKAVVVEPADFVNRRPVACRRVNAVPPPPHAVVRPRHQKTD